MKNLLDRSYLCAGSRAVIMLLLIAVLLQLAVPASFAAGNYKEYQYYRFDEGSEEVYTAQFSAGKELSGAEKNRESMISCGYDAFVYEIDTGMKYRIMSGKFRSYSDAQEYLEIIHEVKGADDAYLLKVTLPESAVNEFERVYFGRQNYIQPSVEPPMIYIPGYAPEKKHSWSMTIPEDFILYSENENSSLYISEKTGMSVTVTEEIVAATSKKSLLGILEEGYEDELAKYDNRYNSWVYYDRLEEDTFDVTGYDKDSVYSMHGEVKTGKYYTVYFVYPKSDSMSCSVIQSYMLDSFMGYPG